jgi:two-component system CheB/CheR fusion protein
MAKTDKDKPKILSENLFPVVGIGASAGGLEAFKQFIKAIPENSGMAYILVQHLHPEHESALPEILQRVTKIPVVEISDNVRVVANHIYVIPSNKILVATDGILQLSPRSKIEKINLPIDIFFSSLAEVHQAHAIGVILSGTGADGTVGLKDIKDHGGLTFAQDPASAAYTGMPQHAIDEDIIDFVSVPEKMPEQIMELQQSLTIASSAKSLTEDDEFREILSLLRSHVGVDFSFYKQTTIRRRILRRLVVNKVESPSGYLEYLKENKSELDILFQDFLIPVTSFFRDPQSFNTLCKTIFPEIVNGKSLNNPLRIWVAGCSTGQEAYSIAICLNEYFSDKISNIKIQIFATDISEKAIKKARGGVYSKSELEGISDNRLQEFFNKVDGKFQIKKSIRDCCVFAVQNFLKDPPFANLDLISCRNVLIYFEPFLQKKAFRLFHYALHENGFLFLGKAESTGTTSDLFIPLGKKDKFFTRKTLPGRFRSVAIEPSEKTAQNRNSFLQNKGVKTDDFEKNADEVILLKHAPAGVVVNDQFDIVQFRGLTGDYLEASPGKPSTNVFKMAKEGLAFELRNALQNVKTTREPFTRQGIPMKQGELLVDIEVFPLLNTVDTYYLVLFSSPPTPQRGDLGSTLSTRGNSKNKNLKNPPSEGREALRILQLEKELAQAREDMRAITEDQESANEELQSSNEELLSGSEELQSLNEELETSKEELQSSNEELVTVNQELYDRNEELSRTRKFADATIATLHEPLLVLDRNFIIKSANKSFYKTFNLTPDETLGHVLFELRDSGWNNPDLIKVLAKTQKNEKMLEVEIPFTFPVIGERNICCNIQSISREGGEQLILLALEDITLRKHAVELLKEKAEGALKERKLMHDFFTQVPAVLAILKGPKHVYEFANPSYLEFVGKGNLVGITALDALPEIAEQGFIELLDNVYNTGKTFTAKEMPVKLDKGAKELEQFYMDLTYEAFTNDSGETEGILIFSYDVTEQVNARKQIEESEQRFSNILSQSIMSIAILKGADLIIAFANEKMMTSWGKGKNIIGKPLLEVLYELKDQPFPNVMQQVFATGVPYYGYEEKAILIINGKEEVTYFNFVCQPYTEVDNSISGITILANEVTEQVLAKKQIDENAERYRFLADAVPEKVWTTDENGIVNYYNQQWINYTGLSFEELNAWNWEKIIHPDDLKAHQKLWKHSIKTGEDFQLEHRFLRHDGEYRWHLSRSIAQKDEKGKAIMWVGTITDIHEQKTHAEEKILLEFAEDFASYKTGEEFFGSLVTYLAKKTGMDYVFIGELKLVRLSNNLDKDEKKPAAKDEKYNNIQTLALSNGGELVSNIEFPIANSPCEKVIEGILCSYPKDCMITFAKNEIGKRFNVEGYIGYPLADSEGNATGVVAVMHKTEIQNHEYISALLKIIAKRAEFEMERLKFNQLLKVTNSNLETSITDLQFSNQSLSQFAYVASHDLQEPLRKILTFSSRLQDKYKDDKSVDTTNWLSKIDNASIRMSTLIQDVLNYSLLLNHDNLFESTNLNTILKDVMGDFDLLIDEKNAQVETGLLPTIEAIPMQMRQLFYNLLGNALKFSQNGSAPVVSITAHILSAKELKKHASLNNQASYCEIVVKDNGIGFNELYMEKIFVIFQRLNQVSEFKGNGIGLALSKKIVENHHGQIFARAKENVGAAFHIILPVTQPNKITRQLDQAAVQTPKVAL